jgi:hypothetical protein
MSWGDIEMETGHRLIQLDDFEREIQGVTKRSQTYTLPLPKQTQEEIGLET